MTTSQGLKELLDEARRNEQIQDRLDDVEEFLLAHRDLKNLLRHLCRRIAQVYELEWVTLVLASDNQRLKESLAEELPDDLAGQCFWQERKELRLILVDLDRPLLSNRVSEELIQCFFPQANFVGSAAVAPLWVRGELLGTLNLGSASPKRYAPGLDTHFLKRLARKVAAGLDAALLLEQTRTMERRQAAVEMAGAACHELAQPLTTIGLLVEKLKRKMPPEGPGRDELESLELAVDHAGELVQRISQVGEYVTRPYAQGLRIIDLDAAGSIPIDGPEGGEEADS